MYVLHLQAVEFVHGFGDVASAFVCVSGGLAVQAGRVCCVVLSCVCFVRSGERSLLTTISTLRADAGSAATWLLTVSCMSACTHVFAVPSVCQGAGAGTCTSESLCMVQGRAATQSLGALLF